MFKKKILLATILFSIFNFIFILNVHANTGITEINGDINYDYINEVLKITNEERTKNNLEPLVLDSELTESANQRAYEIVYSFSHTRPNDTNCFTVLEGLGNTAYGENIAVGYTSPSDVMNGWMNSVYHRENIMAETDTSKLFTIIKFSHTYYSFLHNNFRLCIIIIYFYAEVNLIMRNLSILQKPINKSILWRTI